MTGLNVREFRGGRFHHLIDIKPYDSDTRWNFFCCSGVNMWNFGGLPSILYLSTHWSRLFRTFQLLRIDVIAHDLPHAKGVGCLWNLWKRFPPEVAKTDERVRILSNPSVHFILIFHHCGSSGCPQETDPVEAAALR